MSSKMCFPFDEEKFMEIIHIYKTNEEKKHSLLYPFSCYCEPDVKRILNHEDMRLVIHQSLIDPNKKKKRRKPLSV
jgi:hypothetical protein